MPRLHVRNQDCNINASSEEVLMATDGIIATTKTSLDDVMIWPDGTWCYRVELSEMTHMSDDFTRVHEKHRLFSSVMDSAA